MSKIAVRRPDVDGGNAYYVVPETTKQKGSAIALTATDKRKRGEAYRAASELLKASAPPKKRRRRRKAKVDRLTPEPGRSSQHAGF